MPKARQASKGKKVLKVKKSLKDNKVLKTKEVISNYVLKPLEKIYRKYSHCKSN